MSETTDPSPPGPDDDSAAAAGESAAGTLQDLADDLGQDLGQDLAQEMVSALEEASEPLVDPATMRLELAARRYRLDGHARHDLEALVAAHAALLASGEGPEAKHLAGLRHGLSHEEVVVAACEVLLGDGPPATSVEALHTLALALLDGATRSAAAGARVLLGRCAEHDGDHRAMESQIEAALEADPQNWPALLDAAWFAEDRGDAVHAMSLLTETRVPAFAGEIERLGRYIRSGDQKVGRNDPCPCGSGRKFKACCLNRGGFSLAERAGWLIHKVQGFASRSPQRRRMDELAAAALGLGLEDAPDGYRAALEEFPIVVEIAMFEGGLMREFLERRGYLLPDDERELAERWVTIPLGLWTVDEADGEGVRLTQADVAVMIERPGELAAADPGTVVLMRPLPVPERGHRAMCVTAVHPEVHDWVAEQLATQPTAQQLARIVGVVAEVPPETIDGDPLVLCSLTYELAEDAELEDIAERLDSELIDVDGDGEWLEPADADEFEMSDGAVTPSSSVVLFEHHLVIRAATEARADRMAEVVARLIPEATMSEQVRRPRPEIIESLLKQATSD